eukprot:scaffold385050_cov16-Prasinocladus_malaysianus.AAC.1
MKFNEMYCMKCIKLSRNSCLCDVFRGGHRRYTVCLLTEPGVAPVMERVMRTALSLADDPHADQHPKLVNKASLDF